MGHLHEALRRRKLDKVRAPRVKELLSRGPWCWPVDPKALEGARRLVPDGPPEPRPGEALLVTVGRQASPQRCANLWMLSTSGRDQAGHPFGRKAIDAWDDAAVALTRSVPVLWRSVRDARARSPSAVYLTGVPLSPGAQVRADPVVDGRSFGVSFLLGLASLVTGEPVPTQVGASAQIDTEGRVGAVAHLADKIRAFVECAPAVASILVFGEQAAEAEEALREFGSDRTIRIQPVWTGADVVRAVFQGRFEKMFSAGEARDDDREELFESLRTLTLAGRAAVRDWTPVRRAAELALEWEALPDEKRWWLTYVKALATRHERNEGRLPPFSEEWVRSIPAPIRLSIVSNYVQQCADTGDPPLREVQRLAGPHMVQGREAFVPHLRLQGALARLLALCGDPKRALAWQEEAARGFFDRLEYISISYPLSEWYRLAGALMDREAFDRAEAFAEQVLLRGGLGFDGDPFVELARGKALVLLGTDRDAEAQAVLGQLRAEGSSAGRDAPPHVRWSAVRWLVRMLDRQGESGTVQHLELLDSVASGSGGDAQTAHVFRTLIKLDRATRRSDERLGKAAVIQLARLDPGPVGHLLDAAVSHQADGSRYVADFYPY